MPVTPQTIGMGDPPPPPAPLPASDGGEPAPPAKEPNA